MKIFMREKIGDPDLFVGRRRELGTLLKWAAGIRKELSMSRALLSRRKTGKTAILQRLYNIVFRQNDGLVPFYYEIKRGKIWIGDFCKDFFLTFALQYAAFKTRNTDYLRIDYPEFQTAVDIARAEKLDHILTLVEYMAGLYEKENGPWMWNVLNQMPYKMAYRLNISIMQIIDEFQYINSEIYRDKACKDRIDDMASVYMSTAEYKSAPLLVSGSWVGWLMNDLLALPGRFQLEFLKNMPEEDIVEMAYKYSDYFGIPVSEETVAMMADLSEGNPFYVSSLFKSSFPDKNLATPEGLLKTLEFETLDDRGIVKGTWMEYVDTAFKRINDRHAKRIVLYLSQKRKTETTRKEIIEDLELPMDDGELEKKLKALVRADIIRQGSTNFDYRGVGDNVFDKVFRGVYQKEIEGFDPKDVTREYKALLDESRLKYRKLLGKYNQSKGAWAEFLIIRALKHRAYRQGEHFRSITRNLPEDFCFVEYKSVWSYSSSPEEKRDLQIDVFARAEPEQYSVVGEVKCRDSKKFSLGEAERFVEKMEDLLEAETVGRHIGFVFSVSGFTCEAMDFFEENGIAWSDDCDWLAD